MNSENNLSPHKISLQEVFNRSFFYWKSTLFFQAIVTLLYFGIITIAGVQLFYYYFGDQLATFTPELVADTNLFLSKINAMVNTENGSTFKIIIALIKASMFPLNIGLIKIYSLIDENKKPQFSDIFDGYNGSKFFKFFTQ